MAIKTINSNTLPRSGTISAYTIQADNLNNFKNELEECKNEIKRIEKVSKAKSWKNSKKK